MKAIIAKKQEETNKIVEEIKRSKSFVLFEYQGLSASSITNLRKDLTKNDSKMYVLKNNILSRAFKAENVEDFNNLLIGPNAIAFGFGDEISIFKSIVELTKKFDFVKIKGGYFDGNFVDVNAIKSIASIPSREGLYSMLLSCFTSPIRSVLYALKAVSETKSA